MKLKALILDLDNTIYSVYSIGHELFKTLFSFIEQNPEYIGSLESIKTDIMRKPFQKVAEEYQFSERLSKAGIEILEGITGELPMAVFEDYPIVRKIPCKKFLVTAGFAKMQEGKIKSLGIEDDFEGIHIIDPRVSTQTKKDVFADILEQHRFNIEEVLVVGDDPNSEIKAAMELGIKAVLYDKMNFNPGVKGLNRITNYNQLADFL